VSKLSIIIPVFHNADTIPALYKNIAEVVFPSVEDYELIMIDDGSEDSSWEEMKKIAEYDSRTKLIRLSRNFGSHAAILAGLSQSTGDCAVVKAADMQEPSDIILEMYDSWKRGNKVVLAVRADREESIFQKMFANVYYWMMRKFVFSSMPKGGFDCYLIDRQVIDVLTALDETNSALTLQILWSGFRRDMVYYVRKKRENGKSRWTFAKKMKLIVDSLVSFSFFPVRAVSVIGIIMLFIAIIWSLVLFFYKVFGNIDVQGWTTLMIIVLLSAGMIMFTLGVLGEYIWRTLDAARNRPVFIIDEVKNINKEEVHIK